MSGLLKLFGRSRIQGEVPLLPILEALAGAGAPFFFLTQEPTPGVGVWIIAVLLGLVFVSSIHQARKAGARRRSREESEGGRLATYIKFISVQKELDSPPSSLHEKD